MREICECVIYTLATRCTHFLLNIHTHTHAYAQSKQIIVYLNFMVFLCLGLRFNYNAIYFNFWSLAHSKHTNHFSFLFLNKKKNKLFVFSSLDCLYFMNERTNEQSAIYERIAQNNSQPIHLQCTEKTKFNVVHS